MTARAPSCNVCSVCGAEVGDAAIARRFRATAPIGHGRVVNALAAICRSCDGPPPEFWYMPDANHSSTRFPVFVNPAWKALRSAVETARQLR
jgi:hypothetical protein